MKGGFAGGPRLGENAGGSTHAGVQKEVPMSGYGGRYKLVLGRESAERGNQERGRI